MIRSSSLSLNFSTDLKLNQLNQIFDEYQRVVNLYIDELHHQKNLSKFIDFKIDSWLSARLLQCAGKQAIEIVKSTRKKDQELRYKKYKKIYAYFKKNNRQTNFLNKKFSELSLNHKIKPYFNGKSINLDSRFWSINDSYNTFDKWLKLKSIGNKIKLSLPLRNHKHNKKFNDWKQISSCRLLRNNNKFKIQLIYEKEEPKLSKENNELAIDLGINKLISCSDNKQLGIEFKSLIQKLNNKKQYSKSYYRLLSYIHNYCRQEINKIDFSNLSDLIMEDLKNITINTTNRVNKSTRKLLNRWNLGIIKQQIKNKCEENCVYLHFVNPRNTSRTCPMCSHIDKGNRDGEYFKCKNCGYETNADINAAKNILNLFHQEILNKVDIVPDSKESNFIVLH